MTPEDQLKIKIKLLSALSGRVQETYLGAEDLECSDSLIELIELYVSDIQRRLDRRPETVDYLFNYLKRGIRLAGSLLEQTLESEAEQLLGWYYGCLPQNTVQRFYNLFWDAATDMAASLLEMEAESPELQPYFARERAQYSHKCGQEPTAEWEEIRIVTGPSGDSTGRVLS